MILNSPNNTTYNSITYYLFIYLFIQKHEATWPVIFTKWIFFVFHYSPYLENVKISQAKVKRDVLRKQ